MKKEHKTIGENEIENETGSENEGTLPEENPSGRPPVERVGEFPAEKLGSLFGGLEENGSGQKILLIYAKDGKIVCDRTDSSYLAERNRRRAEAAYAKGVAVGKSDANRKKFHDGYFTGYAEGSKGMPCRDPDAEKPEESLTNCDFRCGECVYACESCGHCTYYDGQAAKTEPEPDKNMKKEAGKAKNGFRRKRSPKETEENERETNES